MLESGASHSQNIILGNWNNYNPLRILPYTNAVNYPKYDHVVINSTYAKAMKYSNA